VTQTSDLQFGSQVQKKVKELTAETEGYLMPMQEGPYSFVSVLI